MTRKTKRFADGGNIPTTAPPAALPPIMGGTPASASPTPATPMGPPQQPGPPYFPEYQKPAQMQQPGGLSYKRGGKVKKMAGSKKPTGLAAGGRDSYQPNAPSSVTVPLPPSTRPNYKTMTKGQTDNAMKRATRPKSPESGDTKVIKMSKGGNASSRADGCAIRGKTRA